MKGRDCSLSGVENQCRKLWEEGHPREEVARTCLEMVLAALDAMCAGLLEDLGPLPVVFSGGVCSNSILRERLTEKYGGAFAAPEFSADNGPGLPSWPGEGGFCVSAGVLTVSQVNFFVKSLIEGTAGSATSSSPGRSPTLPTTTGRDTCTFP